MDFLGCDTQAVVNASSVGQQLHASCSTSETIKSIPAVILQGIRGSEQAGRAIWRQWREAEETRLCEHTSV